MKPDKIITNYDIRRYNTKMLNAMNNQNCKLNMKTFSIILIAVALFLFCFICEINGLSH